MRLTADRASWLRCGCSRRVCGSRLFQTIVRAAFFSRFYGLKDLLFTISKVSHGWRSTYRILSLEVLVYWCGTPPNAFCPVQKPYNQELVMFVKNLFRCFDITAFETLVFGIFLEHKLNVWALAPLPCPTVDVRKEI